MSDDVRISLANVGGDKRHTPHAYCVPSLCDCDQTGELSRTMQDRLTFRDYTCRDDVKAQKVGDDQSS